MNRKKEKKMMNIPKQIGNNFSNVIIDKSMKEFYNDDDFKFQNIYLCGGSKTGNLKKKKK
jgi:hypothetical protein